MNPTVRGIFISKTVWLNVFLAVLCGMELMGSNLTTLLGPKWAAGIVLLGAVTNVALRAYTTMSLTEKGAQSLQKASK